MKTKLLLSFIILIGSLNFINATSPITVPQDSIIPYHQDLDIRLQDNNHNQIGFIKKMKSKVLHIVSANSYEAHDLSEVVNENKFISRLKVKTFSILSRLFHNSENRERLLLISAILSLGLIVTVVILFSVGAWVHNAIVIGMLVLSLVFGILAMYSERTLTKVLGIIGFTLSLIPLFIALLVLGIFALFT